MAYVFPPRSVGTFRLQKGSADMWSVSMHCRSYACLSRIVNNCQVVSDMTYPEDDMGEKRGVTSTDQKHRCIQ